MASKLNHSPESLLDINFEKDVKGYNPLQVDETFDKVIEDYNTFKKDLINADNENAKHLSEIEKLKETISKMELEIARLKNQLSRIPLNELNQDNYQLLKKVNAYERVLYRRGIDLKKALSDPDNC